MYFFAFIIGIYSYVIFLLGILGVLTRVNIRTATIIFFITLLFIEHRQIISLYKKCKKIRINSKKMFRNPVFWITVIIILQALVNLLGALGPELAFDALWYHLTLPKLYLLHHAIYHIPGGLLYYSDMPKLGEMIYTGALATENEISAKVIHFTFGILVSIVLYKFARNYFSRLIAVIVVIIFYANLVVDWESITAYIDLIRTFFELLALWGFINWIEKNSIKWLMSSAVVLGFAITTKVLAIGSLLVFTTLVIAICFNSYFSTKRFPVKAIVSFLIFILISLLIPSPWFLFSFIHTGNPFYPFFTQTYGISATRPNPIQLIVSVWNLFTHSADPLSPVYILFLPLLFIFYNKFTYQIKIIVWYCVLSLLLWYFTPQTGGGRFILPYLPAFSLLCGAVYSEILKKNSAEWGYISQLLVFVIIFISLVSLGYRFAANNKYLPVILRTEIKSEFLTNHLNYSFGDFYDTDGYFARKIRSSDTVLLFGFHNLYYIDFPFIDSSWVKRGDAFNYVAVQNSHLPSRFKTWKMVYQNKRTMVQLYMPPKGMCSQKCHF